MRYIVKLNKSEWISAAPGSYSRPGTVSDPAKAVRFGSRDRAQASLRAARAFERFPDACLEEVIEVHLEQMVLIGGGK